MANTAKVFKKFLMLKLKELRVMAIFFLILAAGATILAPILCFLMWAPAYIYLLCNGLILPCSIWQCFAPWTLNETATAMMDPVMAVYAWFILFLFWGLWLGFGIKKAVAESWQRAKREVEHETCCFR